MNETSEEGPFLDLASYKQVDMPIHTRGNIIKAASQLLDERPKQ